MQITKGYYVVEPLNADGTIRGRFGPYQRQQMRELFSQMCDRLDRKQIEHALTITTENPGSPFDLTDIREAHGQEYIAWSARLTYYKRVRK